MVAQEIYIITDIDGTVVPHPYHSGLSQTERNSYVGRLDQIMRNHHVSCVTGRTLSGWKRLFEEANREPHFPRLVGLGFGSDVYFHGKLLPHERQNAEMTEAVAELKKELQSHPEFRFQAETAVIMHTGKLSGYFIEEKSLMTQIDWNFSTEGLNLKFAEVVFRVLNPHLAQKDSLRCQVFHRRIDLLAGGFVPKSSLCKHVQNWVKETHLGGKKTCYIFGDEIYDDYLMGSIKSLARTTFDEVVGVGVQNNGITVFKYADKTVDGPDDVWKMIDGLLL